MRAKRTKYIYLVPEQGTTYNSMVKLSIALGISYNTLARHFSRLHNGKRKFEAVIKGCTIYKLKLI